jgi:hypothetical protein
VNEWTLTAFNSGMLAGARPGRSDVEQVVKKLDTNVLDTTVIRTWRIAGVDRATNGKQE